MYDVIFSLLVKSIDISYKWLNENLLAHVLTFSKEFGAVVVLISAIIFLLMAVYLIMKQARRLPASYAIRTFDTEGNPTIIPDLRVTFATYQAAASYAQFYAKLYGHKYLFKVLGIRDDVQTIRPSR
jgi:hypothetical protein